MRAILIVISAFGVAFLLVSLLKSWQVRRAIRLGQPLEKIESNYIFGAIVTVFLFAVGVWWLEFNSAPPSLNYFPAKIEDGTITGGGFD